MQRRSASLVCLLVFLLVSPVSIPSVWSADPENVLAIDPHDAIALQEATRILTEEVKLAARPQTYVIVDLVDRAVVIKGRGAELHRFPIAHWSSISPKHQQCFACRRGPRSRGARSNRRQAINPRFRLMTCRPILP